MPVDREKNSPNIAWTPQRSERRRRRQRDGRYVSPPLENRWGFAVRCNPPRLSQLSIRPRAIETDEVVVKTIAEKTHGATPRWLYVVSDRSMPDPCGVMAGNFGDMSSANKYAALAAVLQPSESSAKHCEHELREGGVDGSEPEDGVRIETPMQSQLSSGSGAQGGNNPSRLADTLGDSPGHLHRENVLRVSAIGEPKAAELRKDDAQMPSQPEDVREEPTVAEPAAENEASAPEVQQPADERDDSEDDGDGGMHAKDAEEAGRFDVVMDGDEELQLPAVEFSPEVQERVGRWSADLPSGNITLYLPMPTHLAQHSMVEAAKEALGRRGQMLDAQVKAGSRVVVRVSQAELRKWLGTRNWFKLKGDDTVRGIWCSRQYGAQRKVIVSDRSFTVILKGLTNEYDSSFTQRKLFNVIDNAVPTLVSRSEQL